MTTRQAKRLAIDYALTTFIAESKAFKEYYQTDCFDIEYERKGDRGRVYIVEKDSRYQIADIGWEDVALVLKYPLSYTDKPFMELVKKYNLQPTPFKIIESEETECQETN
jgi:hypothetical protein